MARKQQKKVSNSLGLSKIAQYASMVNKAIEDAEDDLEIELRNPDVALARRSVHGECAFARACKRQDPRVLRAIFFRTTAYVELGEKLCRSRTGRPPGGPKVAAYISTRARRTRRTSADPRTGGPIGPGGPGRKPRSPGRLGVAPSRLRIAPCSAIPEPQIHRP